MSSKYDEGGRQLTLKLTISYDGRHFAGSQRQGAQRTVQAELERALTELWEAEAVSVFAGRTDQGVHAAGQVVSTPDIRPDLSEVQLLKALNVRLPSDIAVQVVERKTAGFHARYDARCREYRYLLWTGVRQPLVEGLVTQRLTVLDLDRMRNAATRLVGSHDFAAFAGGGEGVPWSERQLAPRGTIRTMLACSVEQRTPWWIGFPVEGELFEFRVAADGFLPRMARTIVGTLADIGRGERPVEWIDELIEGRDRRKGAMTAPADGLILWSVEYADEPRTSAQHGTPNGEL